jgi:small-conductance mechanosensitive channel
MVFDNSLLQWSGALLVATVALMVLVTLRSLLRRRYRKFLDTEHTELMEVPLEVLGRTTWPFMIIVSLLLGARFLSLPAQFAGTQSLALKLAVFWQMGIWASTAVVAWVERKRRASLAADRAAVGSISIIGLLVRGLVWALVLLLTLDNFGIDVTALIAGLGIGGIAVALAVQNVLGDLLASLSITLDKPFVVGDFLVVGDFMGSVEHIGIKSTRLRSLSGEQIVMANADLLSSRMRNYGRMSERRIVFQLGVTYETPRDKLQQIPGLIRAIIESQENTRFDRSHFASYGPSSLDFETVYYVTQPDYNSYMDLQQTINFRIHEAFETLGVEFAYPAQKLFITRVPTPSNLG